MLRDHGNAPTVEKGFVYGTFYVLSVSKRKEIKYVSLFAGKNIGVEDRRNMRRVTCKHQAKKSKTCLLYLPVK